MKRYLYLIPWLIFCYTLAFAQQTQRFWVFFKDKGHYESLSIAEKEDIVGSILTPKAMERQSKGSAASFRKQALQQDLPVEENYVDELNRLGFKIHIKSRWFNAVSGWIAPGTREQIEALPFVESVEPVFDWTSRSQPAEENNIPPLAPQKFGKIQELDYGSSRTQIYFHNIQELHQRNLNGKDIVIAMFDTGFRLSHPALRHIDENRQLIAQYDFIQHDSVTSNQPGDAGNQDSHGTSTLSVIGGYLPGTIIGPAYAASFILAKTEKVDSETHQEEDNWAAAAEWASDLGADIVSSSLGYSTFDRGQTNYTYQDMNGKTTIVTRAANFLASRGVLVVTSAGNEGNTSWHYITAPADGFYVLAVGALTVNNELAGFSSRGPTSDGRIKPDVCGLGVGVFAAVPPNGYSYVSGTSVSCPLVAGICAQILEKSPELDVNGMLYTMRSSGDNALRPNNDIGWGKVDALVAYQYLEPVTQNVFPNPFVNANNVVRFPVPDRENAVRVEIYNVLGQKVFEINDQTSLPFITWNAVSANGKRVPSGIYIYRLKTASKKKTGRIVIAW